ncbi:hypothetical protein [Sphaerisporangium rhizosphaerae]|uniref:C2H2-type domain-containing protein n=1 Tax=Sphaerisporangium rhizosphaerae TaxID=2269375 RepID=A0ABW2PFT4_9ACTN
MDEGFSTREIWPFECLRCLSVWEEEYVVRHLSDSHGNDADVWFRAELLVQPPWSGARCPSCGDTGVKTFPRGYLARHPELRTAPPVVPTLPPVPPPVSPAVAAARTRPARAGRARLPAALARWPVAARARVSAAYAVIGLSVALFASLGVFEVLRAAHRVH